MLTLSLRIWGPIVLAPVMFTAVLPWLFRYRRGGMANVGVVIAAIMAVAVIVSPSSRWDPWLLAIFYLYAAAGGALCAVGIYDRKRSAIWAMLAVLVMIGGPPIMPWGFIGFWILMAIAFMSRRADQPALADLREEAVVAANNRTRRSRSIPRKLVREGRFHLLPVFYLLNLSGLGREGITHSGSYNFADHIYRGVPSGTGWLGRWIDGRILAMPAAVAFRLRYQKSQEAIRQALIGFGPGNFPLRVLAIPCGLPRDLTELAATLAIEDPPLLHRIEYVGMDVDPVLLDKAKAFTAGCGVGSMQFHQGNALMADTYPPGFFHVAVSTGLGEFLDDDQLKQFYENVFLALAPGGTFYTSATREEPRSEWMLRPFEFNTHYRTADFMETFLNRWPWTRLTITPDTSGLQSFVVAVK
jgi:SAM-dependent methyltransferase